MPTPPNRAGRARFTLLGPPGTDREPSTVIRAGDVREADLEDLSDEAHDGFRERLLETLSGAAGRLALGVIYIWFGLLKILDLSPVNELVARTIPFFDESWLMPALGVVELAVGLGFLFDRRLRIVLVLFGLHLLGTFAVLVILPEVVFQNGNPLLLTLEGEFVIKNLALLAAGLAVASAHLRKKRAR